MKVIEYKDGMKLVLMVRDSGPGFDQFGVFVNGDLSFPPVSDREKHRYDIDRPEGTEAVVVRFRGGDGGRSAIIDIAKDEPVLVEQQAGVTHGYLIKAV